MRRRSAFIGLAAVLLQALAPLLASAAPGAAVDHVQLCTAQGVVTIQVESGGVPAGPLPAPDHCPVCAVQIGIAVLAAAPKLLPCTACPHVPSAVQPQPRSALANCAQPRAPPRHS